MRGLIWYKKDLRVQDQPALYHAAKECDEGVIALYIIDVSMWKEHYVSHCQIEFILRGLAELSQDLLALGVPLLIEEAKSTQDIPNIISKIVEQHKIEKVFFNHEYEINESRRDARVKAQLEKNKIQVASFDDQLILPFNSIQTNQNDYFKVFTPFKRRFLFVYREISTTRVWPTPVMQKKILIPPSEIPQKLEGIQSHIPPHYWVAGEKAAQKKLSAFMSDGLSSYDTQRDLPSINGTSQLSPYLAVGMISAKTCFLNALLANHHELDTGNKGALTWMSELIWREFYRYVLIAVPHVCMNKPYKLETDQLAWSYDEKLLKAWQQGQTGYPIVDAAMRQLNTIGWMHNRLRMVAAMFLSKNLFLDWRLGEKYFAENLIDFDFASNNGGWQWSASTGTDAAPYFRVFNPERQSERFDTQGQFIRQYCPELAGLDDKTIHHPINRKNYFLPIVDYAKSRARVIQAFKALK